jgi:HEPN domain-containing protein
MTAKKLKTVNVSKNDYKIFLGKAKEFYEVMRNARETGKWTAVGLNAVHCAISCCDALLTFHLGIRSSGEDHMQAVDLLQRLPPDIEEGEANTFKRIIVKKSIIAYECREFRQTEAIEISKLTERFYRWTTSKLPAL